MRPEIQNPKSKIQSSPVIQNVAIVGVGMMGGSLALALRERALAARIVGIDRSETALRLALESDAIDAGTTDLTAGIRDADIIVFATPVHFLPAQLETVAPDVRPDALITDMGSVKGRIVAVGQGLFGPRFVGGHPMAGSERSGFGAAKADLFEDAAWAIVRAAPFDLETDEPARRLAALVSALGANPIPMDAQQHDRIVALVSHLPHLLSFAFANSVKESPDSELARRMAGGSYRDIMRVSAADPGLWRGIFHENHAALLAAVTEWESQLAVLKSKLTAQEAAE